MRSFRLLALWLLAYDVHLIFVHAPFIRNDLSISVLPSDDYVQHAENSLQALQATYNNATGLYETTGWWNNANILTMLANYAIASPSAASTVKEVLANTFAKASANAYIPQKTFINGTVLTVSHQGTGLHPKDFINGFYDDEGWWALAWIRAFDLTNDTAYLVAAASIFDDMVDGYNAPCGGIWWNKPHDAEVAISNELFIETAASLANRANSLPFKPAGVPDRASYFLGWAIYSANWFLQSGLINKHGTINDGLSADTCTNNNGIVWSYNQGVILSALVELYYALSESRFLQIATTIAHAAILELTDSNGILHDVCEPACGLDGTQFKGIFVRALSKLHAASPNELFEAFVKVNADSILKNNRNRRGELSVNWAGPFIVPANASTQSSAMDALVAALSL